MTDDIGVDQSPRLVCEKCGCDRIAYWHADEDGLSLRSPRSDGWGREVRRLHGFRAASAGDTAAMAKPSDKTTDTTTRQSEKAQRFAENEQQRPRTVFGKIRTKIREWRGASPGA
jgi:hypothetical protein